jgi:predicted  nucleic acid-binding Zn-ribbon protein
MDFRTSATRELSSVLDRLIEVADAAAQSARAEATAEAQVTIEAVSAQRATVQQALQEQLDARQALERAHAKLEADYKKLESARVKLESERARFADDNARLVTDHSKLEGECKKLEGECKKLESAREKLESERAKFAGDNARLVADHAKLEAELAKLETDRAKLAREADPLRARVESLQAQSGARQHEAEALRAEVAALRTELESTQTASEALLAEANDERERLQGRLDAALSDATDTTAHAAEWRAEQGRMIRDQAVALVSRTLDRMLAVSATFASVSTEDEVLAAVVEALATEFSRVALFKVGLDRLDVLQHVGFEFPADYTHLVVPQPIGAVLDRAVTSGQIEMLSADAIAATTGTPFGGSPACALALPIDLEGDTCAVLYADDDSQPHQAFASTDLRRTFAKLLRQLAAPLLLRLRPEMKAITELRAYAAHLVAELENMYDADVSAQRKGRELRRRLQDNLECARGIYAQRVSSEPPAAAALLEEELALAASVAHATPFGRDLSALLGAAEPRVAEA